jgi:hypothetical protein
MSESSTGLSDPGATTEVRWSSCPASCYSVVPEMVYGDEWGQGEGLGGGDEREGRGGAD